jgi:hypothetical protein
MLAARRRSTRCILLAETIFAQRSQTGRRRLTAQAPLELSTAELGDTRGHEFEAQGPSRSLNSDSRSELQSFNATSGKFRNQLNQNIN